MEELLDPGRGLLVNDELEVRMDMVVVKYENVVKYEDD